MRSPFRRRRFDSAASLIGRAGMGFYARRGLGGLSPLGQAIATAEGANPVTNNPGNLELGNIGSGTWQAAGGQQITIFPTLDAGQAALENQINKIASGSSTAGYNPSMSIAQVGAIYSGSSNGNWANNVAAALGVTPDTNFASLASGGASIPASALSTPDDSSDLSSMDSLLGGSSASVSPWIIGGLAVAVLGVAWAAS
jgi:hypothetical protein